MVSLTPVHKPTIPRAIQISEPVEFDTMDHMRRVLNETLSKAVDFVEVPQAREECQILTFGPKATSSTKSVLTKA